MNRGSEQKAGRDQTGIRCRRLRPVGKGWGRKGGPGARFSGLVAAWTR